MTRLAHLLFIVSCCILGIPCAFAIDHKGATVAENRKDFFPLIDDGTPAAIVYDTADQKGISIAVENLASDFGRVCGTDAPINPDAPRQATIIAGSIDSKYIKQLAKDGKIDIKDLEGKNEKYIITTIDSALSPDAKTLVVAGSDRRGTIYGLYELSEQIGVSPWYWWADAPVAQHTNLSLAPGTYTAGEPAVRYRGIFLNDEAPCLTSWVKNTYGTNFGDHNFYARVFELLLRLRGNFLWPAMWGWAFYADDPLNSATADEMGIIMGTSHHEPMARNHQEWARHRDTYGAWNYNTNQKVIDGFFTEGIKRMRDTEDVVTIGMRGDGDEAMSAEADVALLERIIANQRKIIKKQTGKKPEMTPQVWALYKEVLDYYDKGLRVPDDVILLLCDDNWGNVRRLPDADERQHPGGWGMYYHVDYVGAPRNTKWINVTPIQGMWEQLSLTYEYGVDRLWVLNVGDLKPMEYPITLFLDMAWNPTAYDAANFMDHARDFCAQIFGENEAAEAARILNLYSKYNGRVTAEMLDANTYSLDCGEWRQVRDDYLVLEAEALRQYCRLPQEARDAYQQLILFPVQAMANLYDMYYAQAMNHRLFDNNDPECNAWADRVEQAFCRDSLLCADYNSTMSHGKWNGMMTQKHIGYTSWNDNFPHDMLPRVFRITDNDINGGYRHTALDGVVAIEAPHYFASTNGSDACWQTIADMGRTLGGVTLMPRLASTDGASLTYKVLMPDAMTDSADVYVVVKSTLAFANKDGHRFDVGFDGAPAATINFNHNLNEAPENIYSVFYPTVARRVVENKVTLPLGETDADGYRSLTLRALDPGVVFEKIVIDCGGYSPSYLYGEESPHSRLRP